MASASLERTAKEQAARVIYGPDDKGDVDSPAYQCQSYLDQIDDVVMMREIGGGTKTMRAAGEKYLPKHPMEQPTKYDVRSKIAIALNALEKTVGGLTGMIFRRDPTLSEDMDAGIREAAADIDLKGHKLPVFLHYAADDALLDGHVWVHIEAPPQGVADTRSTEKRLGLRPYWIKVLKSQAINWRYEMREGKPVLTLFVYLEGGTEPAGAFGERQLRRIRVLREVAGEGGVRSVRGELWEWEQGDGKDKKNQWKRVDEYPVAASRVPVVFLPSKSTGAFESEPPLRDLAYEQAEHYRVRSDRQKSMTFSSIAVPYMFGKGVTDEQGNPAVKWGSDGMLLSNDPETVAGVVESEGHGLEATKEELAEIRGHMAMLGLRMLVRSGGVQPRGNDVTATSDIMGRTESEASLVLFADAIESAANECLELQASYSSKRPKPGTVIVNRDFHTQLMSPQHIQVLHELVETDDLSQETLWKMLVEGELFPEDFDPLEERQRIEAQVARRLASQPELVLPGGDVDEEEDVGRPA